MMSKKLDSILKKVPPATASEQNKEYENIKTTPHLMEKTERLSVEVPSSVKRQIKQYMADHPGETVKTVVMKGLKLMGFNIDDRYLYDLRADK